MLCTHFDADDDLDARLAAAQALVDIADEEPDRPMILAGTFGAEPTSAQGSIGCLPHQHHGQRLDSQLVCVKLLITNRLYIDYVRISL